MEYKYKEENIPNAFATAILEAEKGNKRNGIHRNEVHRGVVSLLGHSLSQRQFGKHQDSMLHEKNLNRSDPTGKRGSRVYLSLTEKGKIIHGLKILGNSIEVQRQRRLYSLLIFFEVYKRGPLLTERQLANLLKAVGSSINEFKSSQQLTQVYHIPGTFYKSIKGIEILGIPTYDPRTKSSKMWYYTVIPGFSVEEFVAYQKALKSGFLSSRTIIPFVLSESYTKKEVEDAVLLFEESGFVQPIEPVFPGEKRFNIADKSIRGLVRAIWLVRMIDYELLIRRLLYSRPRDPVRDKRYLGVYIGERLADKMITSAYHIRRSYKEEKQIEKRAIREIGEKRTHLIQEITGKFNKVIQENEIIRNILEEICYPPFLSSNPN